MARNGPQPVSKTGPGSHLRVRCLHAPPRRYGPPGSLPAATRDRSVQLRLPPPSVLHRAVTITKPSCWRSGRSGAGAPPRLLTEDPFTRGGSTPRPSVVHGMVTCVATTMPSRWREGGLQLSRSGSHRAGVCRRNHDVATMRPSRWCVGGSQLSRTRGPRAGVQSSLLATTKPSRWRWSGGSGRRVRTFVTESKARHPAVG